MEIKSTTDYDQFRTIAGNRGIKKTHAKKLGALIAENPENQKYSPIIVNKKWQIIDGQHRFTALKELQLPVYYVMNPEASLDEVQSLNSVNHTWGPLDYAKSWAQRGKMIYQDYLDLRERYNANHHTTILYMTDREVKNQSAKNAFSLGRMKAISGQKTVLKLERLKEVGEYFPDWRMQSFATALHSVMRSPEYDHDRMMLKMEQAGSTLPRRAIKQDYVRELERVYNYKMQDAKQVRFDYVAPNTGHFRKGETTAPNLERDEHGRYIAAETD